MALLEAKNLGFSYGEQAVLEHIDFSVHSGECVCLLGRNGAGKSTLFDVLLGLHEEYEGDVLLDGKALRGRPRREIAAQIAYVPQGHEAVFNYTALDIVLMGTSPGMGAFAAPGAAEKRRAAEALETVGMAHIARKGYKQISGGERQLVLIARALAQNAPILLLDEPAANLDFGNQTRLLHLLQSLSRRGYMVVFSSHQPDHALLYADKALVLHEKAVHAFGAPKEVLAPELLGEIYGLQVEICAVETAAGQRSICLPVSK